jgi:hypothetical protein
VSKSKLLNFLYRANLIDECSQEADLLFAGCIDNVAILTSGDSTGKICNTLGRALKKAQH